MRRTAKQTNLNRFYLFLRLLPERTGLYAVFYRLSLFMCGLLVFLWVSLRSSVLLFLSSFEFGSVFLFFRLQRDFSGFSFSFSFSLFYFNEFRRVSSCFGGGICVVFSEPRRNLVTLLSRRRLFWPITGFAVEGTLLECSLLPKRREEEREGGREHEHGGG